MCVWASVCERNKPCVGWEWYQPTIRPVILPSTMSLAISARRCGGNMQEASLISTSPGMMSLIQSDWSSSVPIRSPIRSTGRLTSREIRSMTRFVMKTLNNGNHELRGYQYDVLIRIQSQSLMIAEMGMCNFATFLFTQ